MGLHFSSLSISCFSREQWELYTLKSGNVTPRMLRVDRNTIKQMEKAKKGCVVE